MYLITCRATLRSFNGSFRHGLSWHGSDSSSDSTYIGKAVEVVMPMVALEEELVVTVEVTVEVDVAVVDVMVVPHVDMIRLQRAVKGES